MYMSSLLRVLHGDYQERVRLEVSQATEAHTCLTTASLYENKILKTAHSVARK